MINRASYSKVDGGSAVNWDHPVNRGLTFWLYFAPGIAASGGKLLDLVRGYSNTPQGFTASQQPLLNDARFGQILNFQATSQYVNCGGLLDTQWPITGGSISFWERKTDSTLRYATPFASYNDSGSGSSSPRVSCLLPYTDGTIYFDFGGYNSGTTRLAISGNTWDTKWHHWTFVAGDKGLFCYKDGSLLGNTTTAAARLASSTNYLTLNIFQSVGGGSSNAGDLCTLADVRVWNRPIVAKEAAYIYQVSNQGYRVPDSPLRWAGNKAYQAFTSSSGSAWPWFADNCMSGGYQTLGI